MSHLGYREWGVELGGAATESRHGGPLMRERGLNRGGGRLEGGRDGAAAQGTFDAETEGGRDGAAAQGTFDAGELTITAPPMGM